MLFRNKTGKVWFRNAVLTQKASAKKKSPSHK